MRSTSVVTLTACSRIVNQSTKSPWCEPGPVPWSCQPAALMVAVSRPLARSPRITLNAGVLQPDHRGRGKADFTHKPNRPLKQVLGYRGNKEQPPPTLEEA